VLVPTTKRALPYGVVVPTASAPAKVLVAVEVVAVKYPAVARLPSVDEPFTASEPAKVEVAVVEVVVKYGAVTKSLAERLPVTVVVASVVTPLVRVVNEPFVAETEAPLLNVPPRKSPLRTMRFERS